jgi:DNA-binding NtrC family response regulator
MVDKDEFREDLYFRINTFEINLPSLRERREDVPSLAEHLLARAAKGKPTGGIAPSAVSALTRYDWPGNVRELANVMEHAHILAGTDAITADHLPSQLSRASSSSSGVEALAAADRVLSLHDIEMQYICKVLERNHGNKPETARQLGISLKTLYNKLNALQEPPTALAG